MTPAFYSAVFPSDFLLQRGWKPSGRITHHMRKSSTVKKTWWWKGNYEYPQFLALDLERLGWTKILETL